MKNQQLISYLRALPRHGMADESLGGKAGKAQKALESNLEALGKKLPSGEKLLGKFSDTLRKTTGETSNLSMGIGKVIGIQQEFQKSTLALIKNLTFVEESNKALNKSFGVSSVTAKKYADTLRKFAKDLGVGDKKLFEYAASLKNVTGGFILSSKANKDFQKQLMQGQTFMRNNLGLTDKMAESFEGYAAGLGKSGAQAQVALAGVSKALEDATGMDALQLQKDLTSDIAGMTEDMQLQYSKIPGSLELALMKSRLLGTSMEKLHSTGTGLLNIESSVGDELELQMLTGKRLLTQDGKSLTNEFRMATLRGDANKQAELMNHFIKENGDDLETNLIARQKAAKLMNTDEATLAKMIQKQKIIKKMGAEKLMELHGGDIEKVASELSKRGASPEDIQKLLSTQTTKSTADQALDAQNMTNAILMETLGKGLDMTKLKEEALKLNEQITGKTGVAGDFSSKELAASLGKVAKFSETFDALKDPFVKISEGIPGLGLAIGKLNTVMSKLSVKLKTGVVTPETDPVGDALIMPDRGPILRPAPNDVIAAFRPNDTISNTLGGMGGIDYNKLADAMSKVTLEVVGDSSLNGSRRY